MKTLANCSTKEFLVKTNSIRHKAEKFIKTLSSIDVSSLYEKIKDVDRTDRKELLKVTYPLISEILDVCLEKDIDALFEIVAELTFSTVEEVEKLEPAEITDVIFELLNSKRVVDFFISCARLAGALTGII